MPNTTLLPSRPLDVRAKLWMGGCSALLLSLVLAGCHRPLLSPRLEPEHLAPAATARGERPDLDADVRRLAHEDFILRARAAERLVAAGADALPALGRRGDQPVLLYGREQVATTRPVIDAILEALPDDVVRRELVAGEPVVRRAAATALGRRDRWGSVAALIEATEDDAGTVRAAAASSLRRLTNRFFGFRADAPRALRAAATERWRTWWTIEGRVAAGDGADDEG